MLNKVEIKKVDTCFTYALKRIGKFEDYSELDSNVFLDEIDAPNRLAIDITKLKKGDLIVSYNDNPKWCSEYNSRVITEDGKLLFKKVTYNAHFFVYEVDSLISDLTYDHRHFNYIRVSEFKEYDWDTEDFVVRL